MTSLFSLFSSFSSRILLLFCCVIALAAATACTRKSQPINEDASLNRLLKEEWEFELKSSPETATYLGDQRYNSELSDYSPAGIKAQADERRRFLQRFEQIDPAHLSHEATLNRTLMVRQLRDEIESWRLKNWEMPVDQVNGLHLLLAELPGYTHFEKVRDYDDYFRRLKRIPVALAQAQRTMSAGMADHLMPPKYLLEQVVVQIEQIARSTKEQNPFAAPVLHMDGKVAELDRRRIRAAILSSVDSDVKPAFAEFARFVRREYLPQGRIAPGVWSLPDGDARYRFAVRTMTTTSKTPEQFHEIGLQQVKEIETQMLALAQAQGFHDLRAFNKSIRANRKFYAKSGDEIVHLYKAYIDAMRSRMPVLFGHTPRAKLDVVAMESFRAKNAVPADYTPGAPDGSRPGRVNVNTYNPTMRLTNNIEAIAYHEGIPGHHQQISLAQEQKGLPDFRKNGSYNAFTEGWALYSERLGKEIGFYQDPYSDYGRLQNEMWRAVRLVVDTGVHYKHWTRQQMIDFFHEHTAMDEATIQTETDRYIAWPGQALGYKAGQVQILELRDKAKQALGAGFDLKAFHDAVLEEGALPLDVFETQLNSWIDKNRPARQ